MKGTPDAVSARPAAEGEPGLMGALFASVPDALIVSDAAGTIVLANPAAARLLRYAPDALVGMSIDALVPDAVQPHHAGLRAAYANDPRPRPMGTQQLAARRSDGTEVEVEIGLSSLRDNGRRLVVAAIRDVGEYARLHRAGRRSRYGEFVALLGRAAVDARDPHELFARLPGLCAEALHIDMVRLFLLEPSREEFRIAAGVGGMPGEEIGSRVPNRADTPPGFVLRQRQAVYIDDYRREQRFTVPPAYLELGLVSGLSMPLSDRGRPIGTLSVRSREPRRFGPDEQNFLESMANLLAASLQRAASEEALGHAQRLESVGQLTGGIAHDFNNLLTVIQGNLQMLQELLVGDEQGRQLVGAAARAAHRGAELTGKLLAFSRRQVLQPSAVDIDALCGSLSDLLRRTLDQRIAIEVEGAGRCPPALADAGQLESALLNIAINARDAMPAGGTLRFAAGECGDLPAAVRSELAAAAADQGHVWLAVRDSGVGMSDEVRERAFEPFFTTKPAGRGTGLGLSTVYGFVKQSNGAITIDSAPGRGTTVTLYLPRAKPQLVARAIDRDDGANSQAARGLRVLLVEDDGAVAAVVQGFLEGASCRVTAAGNGEQALRWLKSDAEFDLLLSDVALGAGIDGTALAQAAQRLRPRLPVLLMSGHAAEGPDPPALRWELLRKPFSRERLLAAIERARLAPA